MVAIPPQFWFQSSSTTERDRPKQEPGLVLLSMGADPTDELNTVNPSVANLQVKREAKKSLFVFFHAVIFIDCMSLFKNYKVC